MALKSVVGGLGAVSAYIVGSYHLSKGEPLPIQVSEPRIEVGGVNVLPVVSAIMGILPEQLRKKNLSKEAAPPPEDVNDFHDVLGKNPYTIEEIRSGKVWKVKYDLENFFAFGADAEKFAKLSGTNFSDPEAASRAIAAAKLQGKEEQALKDLKLYQAGVDLVKAKGKCKESIEAVGPFPQNMMVVKLNSGGLLLYNPSKVRDEYGFAAWLEGLGRVEWIVSGSSAHTLTLPSVMERFPDAKVILSEDAETKILASKRSSGRKADFLYTKESELEAANRALSEEGVQLFNIAGDVATSALIIVAHKVALEVDLVYSHPFGFGPGTKEELESSDSQAVTRLVGWGMCSKPASPNGALPKYRFWMMDPHGPFRNLMLTPPKPDGSSCRDMANSLRVALKADFDLASGVHNPLLTGEEFRESINRNWNWLDGKSLLD